MIQVLLVFGILTALNMGFGYALSEKNAAKDGAVEVETVVSE